MEVLVEQKERYACSTRTLRELGRKALAGEQVDGVRQEALSDFTTALAENLSTDPEFGELLAYNPLTEYRQVNGLVVDKDGKSITNMIRDGLKVSREAARFDPRMQVQVRRDEGHCLNSRRVDEMPAGTLRVAFDMDPRTAIAADAAFWEGRLGYRRGLASLQVYYKTNRGTVLAGAYSIKSCSPAAVRQMLSDLGRDVPDEIADEDWFRHAVEFSVDEQYAKNIGRSLQQRHRELIGDRRYHVSVTDFLTQYRKQIEQSFDSYIAPLGSSYEAGVVDAGVLAFANTVLSAVTKLLPEERRRLMRIIHTETIQKDDISFLEELVRYGLVENLRPILKQQVMPNQYETRSDKPEHILFVPHQLLATFVSNGRQAGRVYGGCASAGAVLNGGDDPSRLPSKQDVFGGNRSVEDGFDAEAEQENGPCEYIHENCYCCPYNYDGSPAVRPFKVKARRDISGDARCLRSGCGAVIDAQGKVKSRGAIYERALAKKVA